VLARDLLAECKEKHDQLMERIDRLEGRIKAWHAAHSMSQHLASIPGMGVLTASALAATVGEGQDFSNGRQLTAYLGLVPRQASSGGKVRLLGISKRGDGYLRGLLIHAPGTEPQAGMRHRHRDLPGLRSHHQNHHQHRVSVDSATDYSIEASHIARARFSGVPISRKGVSETCTPSTLIPHFIPA
jgi:transposase